MINNDDGNNGNNENNKHSVFLNWMSTSALRKSESYWLALRTVVT